MGEIIGEVITTLVVGAMLIWAWKVSRPDPIPMLLTGGTTNRRFLIAGVVFVMLCVAVYLSFRSQSEPRQCSEGGTYYPTPPVVSCEPLDIDTDIIWPPP